VSKAALFGILFGSTICAFSQVQPTSPGTTGTATANAAAVQPLNARRLAPENAYARVYCIVPIVGSGTLADPRRPMFAPAPPTATAPLDRTGIIAYQFQESDDGNYALTEFVAVARTGLAPVLTSTNANVTFFERGKFTRQQIESAFQQYKKTFSFTNYMPVRAQ
jgi:hypothetical protein